MEIPVEKNKEYLVDIIDNGYEGEGIAKIDNYTIFIPDAIKGERVKVLILKITKSHAFGKIIDIIKKSENRVEVDCLTYKRCGGCNLRHIDYNQTLVMKREIVQNLVNKNLQTDIIVKNTIGMENPYHYRNKAQYPVSLDKENKATFGVYAKRTHEIISFKECFIQNKISKDIAQFIIDYMNENNIKPYDENTQTGTIRHIVVKYGFKTDEVMCIIVSNDKKIKNEKLLVEKLINKFNNIKTIIKNINNKNTNVILGKENIILYGDGYITDRLGDYTFKISPMSFYQINPIQTEKLYKKAIDIAELTGEEILFDLYCGIGTIGIFASKYAKKVYGIEIVEEAVKDAIENAKINNVNNTEFYSGDVEKILEILLYEKKIKPDVVIVDPPRKGLDENTIKNLIKIKSKKIVYISCNPATLIRDLSKLEEHYKIKEINPFDLFPYTNHVECCAVMELKNSL